MRAARAKFVATVGAALAVSACTVTAREPTGYVEVTSAPVDVDVYPHTYYQGRTVYLVNDQWMFRDRGRWVTYRQEPQILYQQRDVVRQQAPPAYNRRNPGIQQAPPGYQQGAPPGYQNAPNYQPNYQSAPPAVRTQ